MTGLNPLNWYGTEFLILYGVLFVGALVASWLVELRLRPRGRAGAFDHAEELAIIGHGPARLAEASVVSMLERGALGVDKKRLWIERVNDGRNASERAILALPPPLQWGQIIKAVKSSANAVERSLINRGLMLSRGEALGLGFNIATPLLMLFCLGMAKLLVGMERERPVGFLIAFLAVTAGIALWRWFGAGRRTKAGNDALKQARLEAARLKIAPTGTEMGMAVALFGTSVIATSHIGAFHQMRQSGSSGDSSSGDSDGGSGCGGGCGGCG